VNAESPDLVPLPVAAGSRAEPRPPRRAWLTKTDQQSVAALAALAVVAIGFSFLGSGGAEVGLIDLSRPVVLSGEQRARVGFQVDVARADWPEWTLLPRIGETLARRIVASREVDGAFETLDDLRRVAGIGPKTLAGIRPFLRPPQRPGAPAPSPGDKTSSPGDETPSSTPADPS